MIIRMSLDEHEVKYGIRPEIGRKYVVIEFDNESGDCIGYRLNPDLVGVGGNMNPEIKRFHGWRGTTCGISKYALGIREVTSILTYKNGNSKVTLSDNLCTED